MAARPHRVAFGYGGAALASDTDPRASHMVRLRVPRTRTAKVSQLTTNRTCGLFGVSITYRCIAGPYVFELW